MIRQAVRTKMSKLALSSRLPCTGSRMAGQLNRPPCGRSTRRATTIPRIAAEYSPIRVAQATPGTPMSSPTTNSRSSAMFTPFSQIWIASASRGRCMPMKNPSRA